MDKLNYKYILENVEYLDSTQYSFLSNHHHTDEIIINKSILKSGYKYIVLATKRNQVYSFYIETQILINELGITTSKYW